MQPKKIMSLYEVAMAILAMPPDEQKEPAFVNSPFFFGPITRVGPLGAPTELKDSAGRVFGEMAAKTPVLHLDVEVLATEPKIYRSGD